MMATWPLGSFEVAAAAFTIPTSLQTHRICANFSRIPDRGAPGGSLAWATSRHARRESCLRSPGSDRQGAAAGGPLDAALLGLMIRTKPTSHREEGRVRPKDSC